MSVWEEGHNWSLLLLKITEGQASYMMQRRVNVRSIESMGEQSFFIFCLTYPSSIFILSCTPLPHHISQLCFHILHCTIIYCIKYSQHHVYVLEVNWLVLVGVICYQTNCIINVIFVINTGYCLILIIVVLPLLLSLLLFLYIFTISFFLIFQFLIIIIIIFYFVLQVIIAIKIVLSVLFVNAIFSYLVRTKLRCQLVLY